MRIDNDKYYTPVNLANYCWDKTLAIIGKDNINFVIEPAVGGGAFLHHPVGHVDVAYDILPECTSTGTTLVITADFLGAPEVYTPGTLVLGNPPYGRCATLAKAFYKKATLLGDFIAFILPISQFNNCRSLYEFDLVHSVDLGEQDYSGHKLHCCFNIYTRPASGVAHNRPVYGSEYIELIRQDSPHYASATYDFRMCFWGVHAGRILTEGETYAAMYKVRVRTPELKEVIMSAVANYNWTDTLHAISCKSISKALVYDVVRKYIEKEVAA